MRRHFGISSRRGGRRYPPHAFAEHAELAAKITRLERKYDGQF